MRLIKYFTICILMLIIFQMIFYTQSAVEILIGVLIALLILVNYIIMSYHKVKQQAYSYRRIWNVTQSVVDRHFSDAKKYNTATIVDVSKIKRDLQLIVDEYKKKERDQGI